MTKYDKSYYFVRYESKRDEIEPYLDEVINSLLKDFMKKLSEVTALDVGCGIGRNVRFLERKGLSSFGMDISKYAASSAKQIQASGIALPIRSNSINLVTAIHFVEHLGLRELAQFLSECYRVLTQNGVLFLITPNGISPLRFLLGRRFFFDPTHVFFSNPLSLVSLLKGRGFSDSKFRFRTRLLLRRNHVLKDLILFVFTSTVLAYFRNVIHIAATKQVDPLPIQSK